MDHGRFIGPVSLCGQYYVRYWFPVTCNVCNEGMYTSVATRINFWPPVCMYVCMYRVNIKSSHPTTFVDISGMREDFSTTFCATVKQSNTHCITEFRWNMLGNENKLCYFNQDNPHFSAFWALSSLVVCWWLWKEPVCYWWDKLGCTLRDGRTYSRGVHGYGNSHGNGIPTGIPWKWE